MSFSLRALNISLAIICAVLLIPPVMAARAALATTQTSARTYATPTPAPKPTVTPKPTSQINAGNPLHEELKHE